VFKSLKSLHQLIYPASCLVCQKPNHLICPSCISTWQQPIKTGQINKIPIYFSTYYSAECAKIILSAKENGNTVARQLLVNAIANAIGKVIYDFKLQESITLITIPSRKSAIRKRGRDHINQLVAEVISLAKIDGIEISNLNMLQLNKSIEDQSKLNKGERAANLYGAYLAICPESAPKNLIIIDDLITTGASVQEAVRVLSIINLRPVAIITACAVGAHL
jgi:predicted amidophosphoribosyltransferase